MGEESQNYRSLLGHYGDLVVSMCSNDEEFKLYVEEFDVTMSDAEKAFRGHYRKVLDFEVSVPPGEDDFGDIVFMAMRAAALRASGKAAIVPLALIDEYIDSFSDKDRENFFDKLDRIVSAYQLEESAAANTFFQDVVYFMHYSRSWELCPSKLCASIEESLYQFDMDWYGEDVQVVKDYKKAFFLEDDDLMRYEIANPESYQAHECWNMFADEGILGPDDDEDDERCTWSSYHGLDDDSDDDDDDWVDSAAGSLMDAINADSAVDPLSSEYKPSDDEASEDSVEYNTYWHLDVPDNADDDNK